MPDVAGSTIVRQFRQIVVWPLQLVPERASGAIQRHWEYMRQTERTSPWREVLDAFQCNPAEFQERHYREFVTFLPYVQRFLYGSKVGVDVGRHGDEPSVRVYRRRDVAQARLTYPDGAALTFEVAHADLYFFLDADVVLHALELRGTDLPLRRVQDTLFRFGRAYPGYWDADGAGANCLRGVEWLRATAPCSRRPIMASARAICGTSASTVRPGSRRIGSICCSRSCRRTARTRDRCGSGRSSTIGCRFSPTSR
jgi:hypothetical protein